MALVQAPTRVLIADRRGAVRFALRTLLGNQSGLQIVGEVAEVSQLPRLVQHCNADLVLMDWGMLERADGSSFSIILEKCPGVQLIVMSGRPEDRASALAAGASAFVNKTDSPAALLQTIEDCCRPESDDN